MRQILVDEDMKSTVAQFIKTPKDKVEVVTKLILYHSIAKYGDQYVNLDQLNPTSMLVLLV